jgi:putative isomerase
MSERLLDVWGGGQLLAFSALDGPTDYTHGLVGRTAHGACGVEIMWPGRLRLIFCDGPPLSCRVAGDHFTVETPAGRVRGAFLDAHRLLIEGPCRVETPPLELCVARSPNRTLVVSAAARQTGGLDDDLDAALAARRRWLDGRAIPADLPPDLHRLYVKALSVMKTQVCSAEGNIRHTWTTPDRWPHRNMWLWDSAFHAIGWRHVDVATARLAIEAVLDMQQPDGRIPISLGATGQPAAFTQPPVLALAAAKVDEMAPDKAWIASLYGPLCRYVQWDLDNRDSDGFGLVEWAIETHRGCRCGESGADNSTRFDCATQLDAPDFNALLAWECEWLAAMAGRLGKRAESRQWAARHRDLCDRMNRRLWSEPVGLYMDADAATGAHTGVLSFAGLLPLVCGAPTPAQAARIAGHVRNPATFGTALPIPSIAPRTSPDYAKDMWRGPVWMNVTWMVAEGLRRYGFHAEADAIRETSLAEISRQYQRYGAIFEFFDDEGVVDPPRLNRKGSCNPAEWIHQVIHDYGWTATLLVDWCAAR